VEVVAGTAKVTIVEIHDPSMVGAVGFDLDLMQLFRKHGISYILKATNANSITHVVWDKAVTPAFVEELENAYEVVAVKPAAMVCVIGSNMAIPGVLARAAQVLAESKVNVNCVSQSLRQVNMQFVIERDDYKKAVVALNKALCLDWRRGAA
jgi:aspartate kinase